MTNLCGTRLFILGRKHIVIPNWGGINANEKETKGNGRANSENAEYFGMLITNKICIKELNYIYKIIYIYI